MLLSVGDGGRHRNDCAAGLQVVVPLSFVSEHVETLEEIDQEYREIAHEVCRA